MLLKFPEPTGFRPPGPSRGPKHGGIWWHIMSHHFLRFVLAFFIALLLRISLRLRQTEQERTHSELSFLKAQINRKRIGLYSKLCGFAAHSFWGYGCGRF
jgi:hypothetical protein